MAIESKYTKWKVIIGYTLIVFLSLLAALLIYKQVVRLMASESNFSSANQKIFIIGNTVSKLYEAEVLSSAFAQTGRKNYFQQFLKALQETHKNIDTLKLLSHEPTQSLRLDSITFLLGEKIKNLQELVWVKQSFSPEEFYNKAIATIAGQDSLQEEPHIRKRLVTKVDTTYVESEKVVKRWGIFSKTIPDTTMKISISHEMVSDTLHEFDDIQHTDTVVNILRNTLKDVQQHSQQIIQKIHQKEYALIQQSTQITNQLKRIIRTYEQEELLYTFQKQQTREKTISTTIQVLLGISGISLIMVFCFIFFILRDLSRSQRYRQKLEEANAYSDQLLKNREKLIQTVSHDIKSPLSSIMGYIELLHTTPVNERQTYFLKNMQNASKHILQLVNNLLDLSKLENNKLAIEEVTFNPKQLFQEIADTFMPLASRKELTLETHFGKELNRSISSDALRIRQIITNILSNAIKYTRKGGVVFSASIAENKQLILQIQDSGSGMTPEEQQLIFKEFSRLKCHNNIEGTGLGLTITLKLIQLLGGNLEVESQPEKGSCFTVTLPFSVTEENTLPEEDSPQSENINPQQHIFSLQLKVLLVDDDPLQLAMTQGLLEKEGIEVDKTTHPREAIELLKTNTYDLMFSDIQMPEMDGFELIREVRTLYEGKDFPVIALSANDIYQEEEYIKQGFTTYLSKPFTSQTLLQLIYQLTGVLVASTNTEQSSDLEEQEHPLYTLKNIRQFTDNNPETLQTILQAFITATQEQLQLFEQHLVDQDHEAISQLAHKMLPIFRHLEAQACINPLEKLERKEQLSLTKDNIESLTLESIEKIKQLLEVIQ